MMKQYIYYRRGILECHIIKGLKIYHYQENCTLGVKMTPSVV